MNTQTKNITSYEQLRFVAENIFTNSLRYLNPDIFNTQVVQRYDIDNPEGSTDFKNHTQLIASSMLSIEYNKLNLVGGGLCNEYSYYELIAEFINNHNKSLIKKLSQGELINELAVNYVTGNVITRSNPKFNCNLISVKSYDGGLFYQMFQDAFSDLENQTLFNLMSIEDRPDNWAKIEDLNPYRAFSGDDVDCFLLNRTILPTQMQTSIYLASVQEYFYNDGMYCIETASLKSTQILFHYWEWKDVKNLCEYSNVLLNSLKNKLGNSFNILSQHETSK